MNKTTGTDEFFRSTGLGDPGDTLAVIKVSFIVKDMQKLRKSYYKTEIGKQDLKSIANGEEVFEFNSGYAILNILTEMDTLKQYGFEYESSIAELDSEVI
jgi:acetoacetate decarboxylase